MNIKTIKVELDFANNYDPTQGLEGKTVIYQTFDGDLMIGTIELQKNIMRPRVRFADGRWAFLDNTFTMLVEA